MFTRARARARSVEPLELSAGSLDDQLARVEAHEEGLRQRQQIERAGATHLEAISPGGRTAAAFEKVAATLDAIRAELEAGRLP